MDNKVKESIDLIIRNMNINWSINTKIRYIYIEIGKIINKDNKFFYTLINIMKNSNYSEEEMIKKQEIDYSLIEDKFEVICNSAAGILKYAFDQAKIKSEIVKIIKTDKFEINNSDSKYNIDLKHYFNSVVGDNDKIYFLRIIPDLMNIQYGLETEHFAQKLTKVKENGEVLNAYEGKQVENSVLNNEDIKKLDAEIGYIRKLDDGSFTNYNDDLIKTIDDEHKKLHMQLLCDETIFFKEAFIFHDENNNIINLRETSIFSLNKNQINNWICHLKNIININYSKIDNSNSLNLIDKICDQVNMINQDISFKEKKVINKRIIRMINKISENYIDKEYIYNQKDKNSNCSTKYLNHKFELMFPYVFGCNFEKENLITSNFKGIAEINSFIDLILDKLFHEVTKTNSKNIANLNINEKDSIIKTRIHKATIINKVTKEYSVLFLIDSTSLTYIFNPNNGNFKKLNNEEQINISTNYIIVSNSIKKIIFESDKTDNIKTK